MNQNAAIEKLVDVLAVDFEIVDGLSVMEESDLGHLQQTVAAAGEVAGLELGKLSPFFAILAPDGVLAGAGKLLAIFKRDCCQAIHAMGHKAADNHGPIALGDRRSRLNRRNDSRPSDFQIFRVEAERFGRKQLVKLRPLLRPEHLCFQVAANPVINRHADQEPVVVRLWK